MGSTLGPRIFMAFYLIACDEPDASMSETLIPPFAL